MPWTTEFHANGADVKYFGAITGADVLEAKAKFFADPQSMTIAYVVCDFTAVEKFDITTGDVQRLVRQDLANVPSHPDLMEVIVAPQPHAFGLARMWEQQVDEGRTRTKVVHQREEAEAWIKAHG